MKRDKGKEGKEGQLPPSPHLVHVRGRPLQVAAHPDPVTVPAGSLSEPAADFLSATARARCSSAAAAREPLCVKHGGYVSGVDCFDSRLFWLFWQGAFIATVVIFGSRPPHRNLCWVKYMYMFKTADVS